MTLADFRTCSLWEFSAAVVGWNRAQGAGGEDKPEPMSPDRYDEILRERGYR